MNGTSNLTKMARRMAYLVAGLSLVAGDIVEVAPAYDHAEITSLAAATIAFEMINLIASRA